MKRISGRFLYISFFLSILLILSSCAPKTRTIDPITQSERSKIKKIAIFVEADEEFNVYVSREKKYWSDAISEGNTGWGGVFLIPLAIVAGLTEHGIRSHIDEKHEESLEAKLTQFHPGEIMTEKLKNHLKLSNADFSAEIPEVKSPSMLKAEGFDTILEVNLKEWEFHLCYSLKPGEREVLDKWSTYEHKVDSAAQLLYSEDSLHFKQEELEEIERLRPLARKFRGDKVRTQITLSGRMILIDDNATVWEREEFYKDENCYWLADLKTQPELLVDILTRAIQNLALNTVNEILQSKN